MRHENNACCISNFAGPIGCVLFTTIFAFGCILLSEVKNDQYLKDSNKEHVGHQNSDEITELGPSDMQYGAIDVVCKSR